MKYLILIILYYPPQPVAFGGIAGLFLGCSLISTMELAYFLLVDLPTFILQKYRNKKSKMRQERSTDKARLQNFEIKNNIKKLKQFNIKSQLIQPQSYESLFYNNNKDDSRKLPHITDWQSPL